MPTILGQAGKALGFGPKAPTGAIPPPSTPEDLKWGLIRLEPASRKDETIVGQFRPENYTENISTTWASVAIPKRRLPHIHWIRGEDQTVRFMAQFWAHVQPQFAVTAEDGGGFYVVPSAVKTAPPTGLVDDLADTLAQLYDTIAPDPNLGRPAKFLFYWGGGIKFECIVESIGDVAYGELWSDSRVRDFRCSISLRKVPDPLPVTPTDVSKPTTKTPHKVVVEGDTFESLALKAYGSPLNGIFLRQESTIAFPAAGDIVKLPNASNYLRKRREPVAYALSDSDLAVTARKELLESLGGDAVMPLVTQ